MNDLLVMDWGIPWPMQRRDRDEWVRRFQEAGYFEWSFNGDVEPVHANDEQQLYRGGPQETVLQHLSWTPSRRLAETYAAAAGDPVWTATVPRSAVLAVLTYPSFLGGYSTEFIVDLPEDVWVYRLADRSDGGNDLTPELGTSLESRLETLFGRICSGWDGIRTRWTRS